MSPQWTEPLILLDGDGPHNGAEEPQRPGGGWRRRLRPYIDLGLLAAIVATAAILARDGAPPEPASATTEPAIQLAPQRNPYPLLIAPATARAGEAVSVAAYRRRDLCGEIELRLDGVRLEHQVTDTIEASYPGWNTVLLTVSLPATGPPGEQELELFGPVPGAGRGGPRCGDREQRHGRIATASIVVSSARE